MEYTGGGFDESRENLKIEKNLRPQRVDTLCHIRIRLGFVINGTGLGK